MKTDIVNALLYDDLPCKAWAGTWTVMLFAVVLPEPGCGGTVIWTGTILTAGAAAAVAEALAGAGAGAPNIGFQKTYSELLF